VHRAFCFLLLCSAASLTGAETLTSSQIDAWRAQIRSNFFIPNPLPALAPETHRRFEPAPGVTAEAVSYATQLGMRVPSILYLPKPLPKTASGRIPAFIVVNGHGGDKYAWYAFYAGVMYARAGAAVLTYDQAGEGERNEARKSGTREHDRLQGGEEMGRRLTGLMMTDVMQAVSYLSSRSEVDSARIGAGGYSLGSFILALTGAVEPRLRACILVGGGNLDGPNEYWDRSKPMCQGFAYRSLGFLGDRPAAVYAMHAARGPTLIYNGLADTVVNMDKTPPSFFNEMRERTVRLRGSAEGVFDTLFLEAVSHRPLFVTRPAALWLEGHLDFPNWTGESIRGMGQTHISEWANANHVAMDKGYVSEEREGGTMALGTGTPGYERESLSVLKPEQWEKRKGEFAFEAWADAARRAR
jgi:dienelactone hydrolase